MKKELLEDEREAYMHIAKAIGEQFKADGVLMIVGGDLGDGFALVRSPSTTEQAVFAKLLEDTVSESEEPD